jgi:two-component system sensor histidine kinase BaeS
MNRLFARTVLTVLGALLILVVLLTALTGLGLQRSLAEWDRARGSQLQGLAVRILREGPAAVSVPDNAALFVYDAAGKLVYSNRGEGARRRVAEQPRPLLADGRLVGYYLAGEMRFRNDAANSRFLDSLRRSLWAGLGLSLAIATGFALLFSRSLSAPAVRVARALDRITHGDLSSEVEESGAREIGLIAASANRLRLQLQREQGLRRQWVQDIAHDLRTPVAALRAQFEGMRDGVLEASPERLDKVLREVGRVQELVGDLEELMRLESPEMRLSLASVDARAVVEEARERFEHALGAKNIRFNTEVQPVTFQADAALIQRALSNFLANAARHCPEGGKVTVAVRRREDSVAMSVANTGDPIPSQDLERVFDRLFRGEYARNSAGSGLGLTIAQRIAQLHGGEVRIANRPDGVIVELRLPQPPQLP